MPTYEVTFGFSVEYSNILNSTEKVIEENSIKAVVANEFNLTLNQVGVTMSRAMGVRKMLGIGYNVAVTLSSLSTQQQVAVVGHAVPQLEKAIFVGIGHNVTVTQNPALVTSSPTTSPTPSPTTTVSKAMTKSVFMYWNIMVALLAFY